MIKTYNNLLVPIFMLTVVLLLQTPPLMSQTNFVKYKSGNPVLPLGSPGAWDDAEAAYVYIRFDGTQYQMWYSGAPDPQFYRIGYATSYDGINWDKIGNDPVLGPGDTGDFDDLGAWQPMVLFNGSQYEMWYSGNFFIGALGHATSADGVTWNRYAGNPVLQRGESGAWDDSKTYLPIVLRSDTLYQMWYTGQSSSGILQTGYATSIDGINWNKSDNPVLSAGAQGEWDSGGASAGSVIFEDGLYHMWYFNWTSSIAGLDIGYATSPDGVNWTKHPDNPILTQNPGDWDNVNTYFPAVIKDGHRWRMWYTGRRSGSIDRLCYAEDFSNAAHVDSIRVNVETALAGADTLRINAYIANPHSENLTANALILSEDSSISEIVELTEFENGRWYGKWAFPAEAHNFSMGVELENQTAGYTHNSFNWGVFEKFRSISPSHSFTQIASIDDGGEANDLIVTSDGIILLANGSDGLRAYTFDGTSFTNIAYIEYGGNAMGVTESPDGTIFLANGAGGLRAYSFNGTSFTNLNHIFDGGSATEVALAADGTVFLANSDDGLLAYSFDGTSLSNIGHINDCGTNDCCCGSEGINISADGTIFLANRRDGLRAYSFDGTTFTNTAHINDITYISGAYGVTTGADGTVFAANGSDGLFAYSFDGASFTRKASIRNSSGGEAHDVSLNSDSTVFLAIKLNWLEGLGGGLWAYEYDGDSFTPTAGIETSSALGVEIGSDGTVFLANGSDGLFAYSYKPVITAADNEKDELPTTLQLAQNYPNPFNPTTVISYNVDSHKHIELIIFNTLGQAIRTLIDSEQSAGKHQAVWDGRDSRGNVVPSGIYIYRLQAGSVVDSRKMVFLR